MKLYGEDRVTVDGIPPRRTSDRDGVDLRDGQSDVWSEIDLVTYRDGLPLPNDPVRAVDVASDQVLDEVIAVEPAPSLSELGDPRPDVASRRPDRDCSGRTQVRVWK